MASLLDSISHLFGSSKEVNLDSMKIYKLLHGSMINSEYQYKVGYNKMRGDFFPVIGEDGGLHCYRGYALLRFLMDYEDTEALIAEVTLPPAALYIEENGVIKTEELILGKPRPAMDYLAHVDPMEIVKRNPLNITFYSSPRYDVQKWVLETYPYLWTKVKNADPHLTEVAKAKHTSMMAQHAESLKVVAALTAKAQ